MEVVEVMGKVLTRWRGGGGCREERRHPVLTDKRPSPDQLIRRAQREEAVGRTCCRRLAPHLHALPHVQIRGLMACLRR